MNLKIENLSKSFDTKVIFSNASLEIQSPGFYLLHGEDGSGKTTLFNILADEITYDSGVIYLNDERVSKTSIAFLKVGNQLVEDYTIEENLSLFSTDQNVIDSYLSKLNMSSLKKAKVKTLSNGEKERASVIMVLIKDCPILLLDEPDAQLDEENIQSLINLLKEEAQKRIVIMVSHKARDYSLFDGVIEIQNQKLSFTSSALTKPCDSISSLRIFDAKNHVKCFFKHNALTFLFSFVLLLFFNSFSVLGFNYFSATPQEMAINLFKEEESFNFFQSDDREALRDAFDFVDSDCDLYAVTGIETPDRLYNHKVLVSRNDVITIRGNEYNLFTEDGKPVIYTSSQAKDEKFHSSQIYNLYPYLSEHNSQIGMTNGISFQEIEAPFAIDTDAIGIIPLSAFTTFMENGFSFDYSDPYQTHFEELENDTKTFISYLRYSSTLKEGEGRLLINRNSGVQVADIKGSCLNKTYSLTKASDLDFDLSKCIKNVTITDVIYDEKLAQDDQTLMTGIEVSSSYFESIQSKLWYDSPLGSTSKSIFMDSDTIFNHNLFKEELGFDIYSKLGSIYYTDLFKKANFIPYIFLICAFISIVYILCLAPSLKKKFQKEREIFSQNPVKSSHFLLISLGFALLTFALSYPLSLMLNPLASSLFKIANDYTGIVIFNAFPYTLKGFLLSFITAVIPHLVLLINKKVKKS